MHIIGIRKFSCIYQTVKEVDFFQLERSYNPFKPQFHTGPLGEDWVPSIFCHITMPLYEKWRVGLETTWQPCLIAINSTSKTVVDTLLVNWKQHGLTNNDKK